MSARYSALALVPVSSATTVAALRGLAPASTKRRSASSGARRSGSVGLAGPRTRTISPFGGVAGVALGQLGRGPAHDLLVQLGQLAADRHLRLGSDSPAAPGWHRLTWRLERDDRLRGLQDRRQLGALAGQKPTNCQRSAGRALATSALSAALGPGRTPPRALPRRTRGRGSVPDRRRAACPRPRRARPPPPAASARSTRQNGHARCARGS